MSIQATQDATLMASTQASFDEVIEGFACPEPVETESTEREQALDEITRRDDLKDPDEVDYDQEVFVSKHGNCYHRIQYGICACPGTQGKKVPLWKAVKDKRDTCNICGPVDIRADDS